jgi:hypothetical protein
MEKYSKNQQNYINSVGGTFAQNAALGIIGKQDMTIAMLLGALKMARLYLDHGYPITARITNNGPTIGAIIDVAITDAEKGGMRVVDSSQYVEVLRDFAQYTGEGPCTTPWQEIVRDIGQKSRKVLGIKETDGIAVPSTEYQTIVYY